MEQKGAFTVALFTGVILLSFLACGVSCRPRNSSSSSNYLKGQQYQPQRYDTHHHHYNSHRLSSNVNSHHHHHYSSGNSNNNHPHHHNKHNTHSHHEKPNQQPEMLLDEPREVDDQSNKISLLHNSNTHQQRQGLALPLTTASATKSARATSQSRNNNYPGSSKRLREEDYEDYEDEDEDDDDEGSTGRHAYLMTTDKKKSSKERMTEDEALSQAFEKHMRPTSTVDPKEEVHDVYAYQLPSDLWFVVRYNKNADGQVEKYMNIVDSFTNYLDKLDKDVKTVSVNVKGVETVFRLTTKHNNSSSS